MCSCMHLWFSYLEADYWEGAGSIPIWENSLPEGWVDRETTHNPAQVQEHNKILGPDIGTTANGVSTQIKLALTRQAVSEIRVTYA